MPPEELYKDGLNRTLFVPFIHLLEERLEVVELNARTDFRLEKLAGVASWHVPAGAKAKKAIDLAWKQLAGPQGGAPMELMLLGRMIHVAARGRRRRAVFVQGSLRGNRSARPTSSRSRARFTRSLSRTSR